MIFFIIILTFVIVLIIISNSKQEIISNVKIKSEPVVYVPKTSLNVSSFATKQPNINCHKKNTNDTKYQRFDYLKNKSEQITETKVYTDKAGFIVKNKGVANKSHRFHANEKELETISNR